MALSDEEGEIVPDSITNYHFVDHMEDPVSFSMLPLRWNDRQIPEELCTQLFLRGTADDGLQQIYKMVIAWKFELSYALPEIYVLSKEKMWIKLYRPRKSYEETIKTTMVTIYFLHFVKKNPNASHDTLWNQILKTLSTFEVLPCENDLFMPLINEAASRDKDIAKSEYMATFISKMHFKRQAANEVTRAPKKLKFVIDDCDDDDAEADDDDEEKEQLFDSVCAYCDDGGEILCCEGRCLRSFHPTIDSGAESFCESLGYNHEQAEAIQTFLCRNCQYQQHQCFACGSLGSSDKSSGAEVFPCVSATCGHFYHPKCVSKLLYPSDVTKAEELCNRIAEGDSFTCPVHKCFECKQVEDKKFNELQFAICRRCPKAYHRKCLPRTIMFENDKEKKILRRAWEGLLPNRVLIYCMDHVIIPKIGTPKRNHLVFPDVDTKKQQHTSEWLPAQMNSVRGRRSKILGSLEEKPAVKEVKYKGIYSPTKVGNSVEDSEKGYHKQVPEGKIGSPSKSSKDNWMSVRDKCRQFIVGKGKTSAKDAHLKYKNIPDANIESVQIVMSATNKAYRIQPTGNAEIEKRVLALIESSTSSFNQEEFVKERKSKSIHAYSSRPMEEKTMTMGKVEHSVKAVRAALKKLEDGGTIEDAKAVCEPEILNQIIRWRRKLRVYLAPVLHAMRYTSFGRHFTKVDKLKEIVERLRWYIEDGDTVVDFCCGSNDFSCLMKEALDKLGRKCSFKNYDLIQPKNAFCFEKRDWMSVRQGELPAGSNLVMGLNPPFGVHAGLANKFITKALKFSPKLLILIVPKETKRLDKEELPYDLIWEDDKVLSGKSFYLPGSVDVHAQQMEQWNVEAPPLYLWSRPDWTAKHRAIAQEYGHMNIEQDVGHVREINVETSVSNYLMEDKHDCYRDFSSVMKGYTDITSILDDLPEEFDGTQHYKKPDLPRDTRVDMQFYNHLSERCSHAEKECVDKELSTPTNFRSIHRGPTSSVGACSPGKFGIPSSKRDAK